jgi:hypothetical protein
MDTNLIIAIISLIIVIYLLGLSVYSRSIYTLYGHTTSTMNDLFIYIHKNIVTVLFLIAIGMIMFM